jgi:hypothetical protein
VRSRDRGPGDYVPPLAPDFDFGQQYLELFGRILQGTDGRTEEHHGSDSGGVDHGITHK